MLKARGAVAAVAVQQQREYPVRTEYMDFVASFGELLES
jgi:hypothetical protein